jgi:HD-GYP domain-containing protein (c-di-GMP phosphodiesterase class II)
MGLLDRFFTRSSHSSAPLPAEEKMLASLLVMAWMVEARDPYTGGHLWRVSRFARLLADEMGLAETEAARISVGGFLHDLGKIGVPDAILGKAGRLTDEEYDIIKTHPAIGQRMLSGHPFSALVMDAVAMHHETPDGRGYPRGLKLAEIPLAARIVGLCDAFDAMTSTRPYRRGMPVEQAMGIIGDNLGSQFDAEIGARFIALAEHAELRHIVGHSDEGIPLQECLMCGPTIVLQRGTEAGDYAYCRACGGEYRVEGEGEARLVVPTGGKGDAAALEPRPDEALIARLVAESARVLHTAGLTA